MSMPLVDSDAAPTSTSKVILNWWDRIEQETIKLSLKYQYLLNTDITDCYGSIYTHSIVWALHLREVVKLAPDKNHGVGSDIDKIIQAMSYRQTNGIPQGSVIMDFIAELVLTYADELLGQKLEKERIGEYEILRYRDDYRILTQKKEDAEFLGKCLSEVLCSLNLRINTHKTSLSDNIITDSIKSDKLFWIRAKHSSNTLQKQLLIIHSLSEEFPNSGSVRRSLSDFYRRLIHIKKTMWEDCTVLMSIVVDIAMKNPSTYKLCAAILSELFQLVKQKEHIKDIVSLIQSKFSMIPNTEYMSIWLQRISIKSVYDCAFNGALCKNAAGLPSEIWNSDWLNDDIKKIMNETPIIDLQCMSELPETIPSKSILFDNSWKY